METTAISVETPAAKQQKEPLAGAYFWLLVFFVVYCARPEDWIPGVAALHLAKVAGLLALVAFVMSIGQLRRGMVKEVLFLFLLLAQFGLASVFSPVWKGGAIGRTVEFSKIVLIVVVMSLAVSTLSRLRKLIFVQSASVAVISLISILKARGNGGRLEGALHGIYANSNDLALAIVLSLPFCFIFLLRSRNFLVKFAWSAAIAVMVYAVFLTASRSGLLALVISGAVCLWDLGVKGRRLYLVLLTVVLGLGFFIFSGQQVRQRLAGTFSSQGNYEYAHGSAEARTQLLIRSLEVTAEHPLLGVGPGNFPIVSGSWHQTHNVYTALSSEGGLPALIFFLLIYRRAFLNLREVREQARGESELSMLTNATRASLLGFALAAFFFPDAFQFFVYFMFAYSAAVCQIAARDPALLEGQESAPGRHPMAMPPAHHAVS